jgi:hypothetical protein
MKTAAEDSRLYNNAAKTMQSGPPKHRYIRPAEASGSGRTSALSRLLITTVCQESRRGEGLTYNDAAEDDVDRIANGTQ